MCNLVYINVCHNEAVPEQIRQQDVFLKHDIAIKVYFMAQIPADADPNMFDPVNFGQEGYFVSRDSIPP